VSVDKGQKLNLFGGGSDLQSVADDIYGVSEIPDSGRVVARPTSIMQIWRDPKQPRRAIPSTISMHNDGNPLEAVPMLQQWQAVAEEAAGVTIPVEALLNGEGEGLDTDKFPSVSQEFVSLVRLAQGIKADGLINPITIIESDGKLLIESGERRWLAYHLLNVYLGDQWAKIPAAKSNGGDSVWRQASENTQRRALNAIGMARQIALLIMETRSSGSTSSYKSYEDMVKAGGSDRRFYAQVADGNVHRIPKGMGERIQAAMGLSMEQLSRYRALLEMTDDQQINDALWTRADVENWPEFTTREVYTLPSGKVRAVIERVNWSLKDLQALKEVPVAKPFDYPPPPAAQTVVPRRPVTSEWMQKTILTKAGFLGVVVGMTDTLLTAEMEPDGKRAQFNFQDVTLVANDTNRRPPVVPAPSPQRSTSVPGFDHEFRIGDKVRTRTGHQGEVVGLSGRLVTVRTANGTNAHDHTLLTKIAAEAKFVIGDKVRTRNGRTGGVVEGYQGEQVRVNFPGSSPFVIPEYLLFLEDEEPQLDEDDIEEDVDPDAPAPAREWREGWTNGLGGNNQLVADKADSVEASPELIIDANGSDGLIYANLIQITEQLGDDETASMLKHNLDITDVEVRSWGNAEQVSMKLNGMYAQLSKSLEKLLTSWYAEQLQLMEEAVN
jgi:hypothetical protein